jgi:D-galactarolactone isomerase
MIERRGFIKGASLAVLAATSSALSIRPGRAQQVPNSSGTEPPRFKAPANACDCHMHVIDVARFPTPRPAGTTSSVADYRLFQHRIGTTRTVVVQPRNFVLDNRAALDGLAQMGDSARGVVVVDTNVTDAELKRFNDAGVRGTRFSLADPNVPLTVAMIEPLSKRLADLGWHIQFHATGDQIVELADLLRRLPSQLVFDHMGQPPVPAGIDHPSHAILRGLIDRGRTWVKLSNVDSNSRIGPPSYPEATKVAQAFVKAAPERLVWGSDWPHPGSPADKKPNDAQIFDLLPEWAPEAATRNRILVQNPEALYGFPKTA